MNDYNEEKYYGLHSLKISFLYLLYSELNAEFDCNSEINLNVIDGDESEHCRFEG